MVRMIKCHMIHLVGAMTQRGTKKGGQRTEVGVAMAGSVSRHGTVEKRGGGVAARVGRPEVETRETEAGGEELNQATE